MIRFLCALLCVLALPCVSNAQTPVAKAVGWSGAVELAQDSGTISIPMPGVKDLKLSDVAVSAQELKFSIKEACAVWVLKVAGDGQTAQGTLTQGGTFKTTMKRLAAGEAPNKELARPKEPKAPFPYETSDVSFENKAAGVTLAARSRRRKAAARSPARCWSRARARRTATRRCSATSHSSSSPTTADSRRYRRS